MLLLLLNNYQYNCNISCVSVDASIDYLNHYRLVDNQKAEVYARAFVVEDEDMDCMVTPQDARQALQAVPAIQAINPKQVEYCLKVSNLFIQFEHLV